MGRRRAAAPPAATPPDPPPPPSGADVNVGLLWRRGGGAEATLEGLTREEAIVPASADSLPPPPAPPAAAAGATHSALKDRATYDRLHASSVAQGELFFHNLGNGFVWRNKPATGRARVVAINGGHSPRGSFFPGGRFNVTTNCVTRHVDANQGGATAVAWPGGGLPFIDASVSVARVAGWLRRAGVSRGEAVALYLPAGPDAVTVLLAVTALGAAALVLDPAAPADASAAALAAARARVAVTASGGTLTAGGATTPIKAALDEALTLATDTHGHSVETVLCYEAGGVAVADTPWTCSRDVWAAAALPAALPLPPTDLPACDADTYMLLVPVPGAAHVVTAHAAGSLVCGAATARLVLDAQSDAVVAFAGHVGHPASLITGTLGALANGSAVATLPPPGAGGGAAWWQAAAAARVTHVVATPAAAAELAHGGPPPATLQLVAVVGEGRVRAGTTDALARALGESVAIVSAWQPPGAGTPVLAGAPHAIRLTSPAAMVPWLGCGPPGVGGWTAAWPALATRTLDAGDGATARAWWEAHCVGAGGAYAPDEDGLEACAEDEGAWRWA